MEEQHIELALDERLFLKRICAHWRATNQPLEFSGFSYSDKKPYLTRADKVASRRLLLEDLVEVDLIPSIEDPPYAPDLSIPIANTSVYVKIPIPNKQPVDFDILFTPTKRGLDNCFIEEI